MSPKPMTPAEVLRIWNGPTSQCNRAKILQFAADLEAKRAERPADEKADEQGEIAALRVNDARYKVRRAAIFQMRLRTEIPGYRNWKPTTVEEFNAEYDAACDKEISEQHAARKP